MSRYSEVDVLVNVLLEYDVIIFFYLNMLCSDYRMDYVVMGGLINLLIFY